MNFLTRLVFLLFTIVVLTIFVYINLLQNFGSTTKNVKEIIPSRNFDSFSKIENVNIQSLNDSNTSKKKILFVSSWWGKEFPLIDYANKHCPKCVFKNIKTIMREDEINSNDALVFFGILMDKEVKYTKQPNQIWVYLTGEPPYVASKYPPNILAKNYNGLFNWTMTYRFDSDIFSPYGRFIRLDEIPMPNHSNSWAFSHLNSMTDEDAKKYFMKTPTLSDLPNKKFAAWIVSNCKTSSKRQVLVNELAKYIPIDIYGKCGNHKCSLNRQKAFGGVGCHFEIAKDYKFYLAFENSLCEDYITEKYFDTLLSEMIPIVFGGANYSSLFPPKTFINVADFSSVQSLAEYLKYLDENPREFLKYFDWRKTYWVSNNGRFVQAYCKLCDKLWQLEDNPETKVYEDVWKWWDYSRIKLDNGSRNKVCFPPESLPIFPKNK